LVYIYPVCDIATGYGPSVVLFKTYTHFLCEQEIFDICQLQPFNIHACTWINNYHKEFFDLIKSFSFLTDQPIQLDIFFKGLGMFHLGEPKVKPHRLHQMSNLGELKRKCLEKLFSVK